MSDNHQTTTLILAGGKGSRLNGVDKGLIKLADKHLIDYSRDLAPAGSLIVASVNRNISKYAAMGYETLSDQDEDFAGPMLAIWHAAAHIRTSYLLVLPCDTPLLPDDIAEQLLAPLQTGELSASFASHNGHHHYCCMAAATSSIRQIKTPPSSMRHLLESINAQAIDCAGTEWAFLNINADDDLTFARSLLTST